MPCAAPNSCAIHEVCGVKCGEGVCPSLKMIAREWRTLKARIDSVCPSWETEIPFIAAVVMPSVREMDRLVGLANKEITSDVATGAVGQS